MTNLVEHYHANYEESHAGYQQMRVSFDRLGRLAKQDGFQVILALTPDIHVLSPYPFTAIHERMERLAESLGWTFVDFTETLQQMPAEQLSVMPGDPHLNGLGHRAMADVLEPYFD